MCNTKNARIKSRRLGITSHMRCFSNTFLACCRWYLTCLADSTPKFKRGLREKFEDGHLNKPTSIDSNFQGDKKSHDAKRIRKTKNQ